MALAYATSIDALVAGICGDVGSATSIQIDTDWTFETAAKEAFFLKFVSPISQTTAALTVYAYCTAVTGVPTFGIECRNGALAAGDPDRPEAAGAAIGTAGADITPVANRWATFTFSSLTLVAGQTYFLIVKNTSGDPTTAHAAWQFRGATDSHTGSPSALVTASPFLTGHTAAGFTADPTLGAGVGCAVVKFGGGTIWGFPWVSSTAHPNDANDRGNRAEFAQDTTIVGVGTAVLVTSAATIEITRVSDSSVLLSQALDETAQMKGAVMFPAVTLLGGVAYNVVVTVGGSTTAGPRSYMGEADGTLPADVQACRPSWFKGFVGGATSPGSYVLTEGLALPMALFIDAMGNAPGGGGGGPLIGGRLTT